MVTSIHRNRTIGTADGIDPLRCARSRSGYRNVYYVGRDLDGRDVWKARVKRGGYLRDLPGSRSTSIAVPVEKVRQWYRETFGPNWMQALKVRKHNPHKVTWSEKYQAYRASVWVEGQREEVVRLRRKGRRWVLTDRLALFLTRDEARRGVRRYMELRFGIFAAVLQWRG